MTIIRRAARGAASALLAAVTLPTCSPGAEGSRSLLVITLDTTRADHLHAYGYPLPITPHLDALAASGVTFLDAYAPMPQTLPSHATLFTGLDPRQHGTLENLYVLREDYHTLAESARARGYATGAFVGALVLDRETGMAQGFDTFDEPAGKWNAQREGHPPQRRAAEVTDAALGWARGLARSQPFLLWAHYYDPHGDSAEGFRPPAEHLQQVPRQAIAALLESRSGELVGAGQDVETLVRFWRGYAAEIRSTDEQVGRLLQGLRERGLLEETIVVVVGDHGEGLWEHGIKAHGQHVWEEIQRVPFLLVDPAARHAGKRVPGRVTLRDVVPTLERLAFGETREHRGDDFGLDLWDFLERGVGLPERPVFVERPHFGPERAERRVGGVDLDEAYGYLTAVILGRHKLVREPGGTLRLYDLEADPAELVDVAAEQPEVRTRLARLLEGWLAGNEVGPPGEDTSPSPEKLRVLRDLGYIK